MDFKFVDYLRTILNVKRNLLEAVKKDITTSGSYSKSSLDTIEAKIEAYNEMIKELGDLEELMTKD